MPTPALRAVAPAPATLVKLVAAVMLLAVLALLAAQARHERADVLERVDTRNALIARALANEAGRHLDATARAAAALAQLLQDGARPGSAELSAALRQAVQGQPALRGAAVLGADGRVLAAAGAPWSPAGTADLAGWPPPGRDALGPFDRTHGLPLLRGTLLGSGERGWVALLIDAQALASLPGPASLGDGAAALVGPGGALLAVSGGTGLGAELAPGAGAVEGVAASSWVGPGLRPGLQRVSTQAVPQRPLTAWVEQDEGEATAEWLQRCQGLAVAALAATLLVAGLARLAVRSLRLRDAAHDERDAAQAAATQRMKAQLAFNRQLLEASPLPVSVTRAGRTYVTVNAAWEAFHGRRREDAIGAAVGTHLPAVERRVHEAHDRLLLKQREPLRYEATVTGGDGRLHDVVINKMLLPGEEGSAQGILTVMVDVTEFRNAERATREARDTAEEASRAKSEFIANISHELRTPLQAIIGFSELGQHRSGAEPRLAAMFTDIHGAGQRMLALVNDLLDVAKIESTVGTIHLERTDLRGVVREALRELQPLLAGRQLRVALALPETPMRAKVDPLRIQQVLRNVLANAIKFSPAGATIDVRGEHTAGDELHLVVADRGPGIPPGELEKIFEAFVQSSQTKDGSGGTGLGLAICRKIALAHGGHIHAANREGGGSEFRLVLPARSSAETLPLPL